MAITYKRIKLIVEILKKEYNIVVDAGYIADMFKLFNQYSLKRSQLSHLDISDDLMQRFKEEYGKIIFSAMFPIPKELEKTVDPTGILKNIYNQLKSNSCNAYTDKARQLCKNVTDTLITFMCWEFLHMLDYAMSMAKAKEKEWI